MIEKPPASFVVIGEKTLHPLVDNFYGLVEKHPDSVSASILSYQLTGSMINAPGAEESGESQ
jgi:truncated hemoglobin YjbI